MPPLNTYVSVSREAVCLIFSLSFHLYASLVYATSEGSGKYTHMHKHACPLADVISTKSVYTNPYFSHFLIQNIK